MKALVDHAKANPGNLSYGVGNSTTQIVMEALKKRTGSEIVRVPYRSNPMVMTDLLGGQIQIMVADLNGGMPAQGRQGRRACRPDPHPSSGLAGCADAVRDGDARLSHPGLGRDVRSGRHAPEAVKTLAGALHKAVENPEVQKRFASGGTDIYWSDSREFAELVKTELVSWRR